MSDRVVLRKREDFERDEECYRTLEAADNHLNFLEALLQAHCAGMKDCASASRVLEVLRVFPDVSCKQNQSIKWLLGSIRVEHVMYLYAKCGVSIGLIAEHVRFHGFTRKDLIRFLNQFTITSKPADC